MEEGWQFGITGQKEFKCLDVETFTFLIEKKTNFKKPKRKSFNRTYRSKIQFKLMKTCFVKNYKNVTENRCR